MGNRKKDIIRELEGKEVVEPETTPTEEVTPDAVEEKKEPAKKTVSASALGVVNCDRLNVRAAASLDARIVKVLTKGTEITIRKSDDPEWLEYTGVGFVMAKFITRK